MSSTWCSNFKSMRCRSEPAQPTQSPSRRSRRARRAAPASSSTPWGPSAQQRMHGLRLKLERGPKFRDKRNMCITGRASSVHVSILGEYTKGTWFNRTSTRNIRMARLGKIPARFICRKKMHAPNGQEEQCCGPATRAWQWTSRAAEPDPQRDSQTCQPVLALSKSMIDRRTVCRARRVTRNSGQNQRHASDRTTRVPSVDFVFE